MCLTPVPPAGYAYVRFTSDSSVQLPGFVLQLSVQATQNALQNVTGTFYEPMDVVATFVHSASQENTRLYPGDVLKVFMKPNRTSQELEVGML